MLGLAGYLCAAGSRTTVHGGEAVYNALTKNGCIAPTPVVLTIFVTAPKQTVGATS